MALNLYFRRPSFNLSPRSENRQSWSISYGIFLADSSVTMTNSKLSISFTHVLCDSYVRRVENKNQPCLYVQISNTKILNHLFIMFSIYNYSNDSTSSKTTLNNTHFCEYNNFCKIIWEFLLNGCHNILCWLQFLCQSLKRQLLQA